MSLSTLFASYCDSLATARTALESLAGQADNLATTALSESRRVADLAAQLPGAEGGFHPNGSPTGAGLNDFATATRETAQTLAVPTADLVAFAAEARNTARNLAGMAEMLACPEAGRAEMLPYPEKLEPLDDSRREEPKDCGTLEGLPLWHMRGEETSGDEDARPPMDDSLAEQIAQEEWQTDTVSVALPPTEEAPAPPLAPEPEPAEAPLSSVEDDDPSHQRKPAKRRKRK